jgi:hypothetical protein
MHALKFEADQKFFWASLDAAAAVAHGRHSGEGEPRAAGRLAGAHAEIREQAALEEK